MSKNYCEHCGSLLNPDNSCPNCDKYKLKKENTLICTKCGTEIHYNEFLGSQKKKFYILKCSKCKTVLKGKKIIIARNIAIFSGLSAALILGIVNANPNLKENKEIKVNYKEENYTSKEDKKRIQKLEGMILRFSKTYNVMYSDNDFEYDLGCFNGPLEFKESVIKEIKEVKSKNITKFVIEHTYLIKDEFNDKNNIGKATIHFNGSLSYNNEYEKRPFNKKIEIAYEYNKDNVLNLVKYSVLEEHV